MRPLKVKVSVSLDHDIVDTLKELSEQADRSFSQYVNIILKKKVQQVKEQERGGRKKRRI